MGAGRADGDRRGHDEAYEWFSVPVAVSGLIEGGAASPVLIEVNFSELLARVSAAGIVDEHSIRLYRKEREGSLVPEPVQFNASPQRRAAERPLLPGTPSTVSYLGEYAAGEKAGNLEVTGELSWLARPGETGRAEYRLDFGCLRHGRAIQVPFEPQNLRMFDEQGRATPIRWFPGMQVRPQWPLDGKLHVLDQNQLVTTYYLGPMIVGTSIRRPFMYPVMGPDGVSLTEFGKPHDPTGSHAHHYSLWVAHAKVGDRDFWSERGGVIANDGLETLLDGPVFCRVSQRTKWSDAGDPVLLERRAWTFYKASDGEGQRLIDVALEFRAPADAPVVFGKTSFGFLAARVAQSMTVFDGGGEILNAHGDRNEQGAHLKRAAWIDQSGPVTRDRWNGIAIMDHPDNPNHPTPWHCRNDGWVGAAFNAENAFTLEPGKSLRLKYRLFLHRHNAIDGQVAARYREYAARPVCQLGNPTRHSPTR